MAILQHQPLTSRHRYIQQFHRDLLYKKVCYVKSVIHIKETNLMFLYKIIFRMFSTDGSVSFIVTSLRPSDHYTLNLTYLITYALSHLALTLTE